MPVTFLLPQSKALRATKANLAAFRSPARTAWKRRNLERCQKEAEAVAEKLDGQQFIVIRSASEAGALYGSVTARDAAEAATEGGFTVEKRQIVLERPVKELGLHPMSVVLHPEVTVEITINVARTQEEAEIQASGKSIQDLRAEEDAEADFDIAELFDDVGGAASDDDAEGPAPVVEADGEDPRG